MKKMILLLSIFLAGALPDADLKVYPNRWVRVSSGLRDDAEVDKVRRIARTASEHGLTGIVLSAGLDQLDLKDAAYIRRLKLVRELCGEYGLAIIPSILSVGYGGSILAHDRNLAAGLPVRNALFVVNGDRAKLVPDPAVRIVNGGFEDRTSEQVADFRIPGNLGGIIKVDTSNPREGTASLRFADFDKHPAGSGRLTQEVRVQPYRCYRLTCWVRTENLGPADPFGSGNLRLEVAGLGDERRLQYQNPRMSSDGDWQKVAVGFNSWGYEKVDISLVVSGATRGTLWVDDLKLEEVGLINVLRRPGTPLLVKSEGTGTVYEEGLDYEPISDPELNFSYDHEGPAINVRAGSRIREGERLRVSYYHGTRIYSGQTPVCMSEPKVYEIWREQARLIHEALAPKQYLLNMDEVRTGGSCEACRSRGMSMGQILGDCITRQFRLLKDVNPEAEIFVWSDMLDPNHNANPGRKHYYLAEGTFTDAWRHVPREIIIACWYHRMRTESLKHFSTNGFRTLAAGYYDSDNLDNVKEWLEALDATAGATGIMYTTWLEKYDLLPAFGDMVSRR